MGYHNRRDSHQQQPPCHRRQASSSSTTSASRDNELDPDLLWPFGKLNVVDKDDIRETAYEVFFTSCRSSPGFGGRTAIAFYSHNDHHVETCNNNNNNNNNNCNGPGSPGSPGSSRGSGVGMVTNSRIKRALGLRTLKRMPSRRSSLGGGVGVNLGSNSGGGGSSSPHTAYGHVSHHSHSASSPGISFTVPTRTTRRPLTSAEIMRLQMRVTEQSDNRLRKTLMRTLVGQVCTIIS